MVKYIARRLLQFIIVLAVSSILIFLLDQARSTAAAEWQQLMERAMDIIMDEVPIFVPDYPGMVVSQNVGIENTGLNASCVRNLYAKNFIEK